MKIGKYKKLKKNLYEVEIDGSKARLYDDVIIKYELLLKRDIDKETFKKVCDENEELHAYYKALNYINIKLRSEKEIVNYLSRLEINRQDIEKAIDKLKKEGYLDVNLYLRSYINDQVRLSYHGPYRIKSALSNLGFDDNDIEIYLAEVDSSVWEEKLDKIIDKRKRLNKNVVDAKFINKTYMYLFNLGYSKEQILSKLQK